MTAIYEKKILLEAKTHLTTLRSRIGKMNFDQVLLKQQIKNTKSLIDAINNNEPLIGKSE